jgi:hypothetical protein
VTRLRWLLAALAAAAALWAAVVQVTGGIAFAAAAGRLTSTDPVRPALAALVLTVLYLFAARRGGLRADAAWVSRTVTPARLAAALAAAAAVIALLTNARVAGASDSFGYVMHADAWVAGSLKRPPEPLAASAPWPRALETFTPFWHHPSPDRQSIVPVMSPGLPLLMALFRIVAGHCAMFWVVPLTAALLVWVTFAIGRRVVSPAVGLGAAWLVATSPTVLTMSRSAMSDVPAAAFWGLAAACLLRPGVPSAFGAGLAASLAIFTRPNLLPVGIWMGAWAIWRELAAQPRRPARVAAFAAGAAPGCLAVAAVNLALRQSPVASGYGSLDALFSIAHIPVNVSQFFGWLVDTQTPLWVAGFAALVVPVRALWPSADARRAAVLLFGVAVAVWGAYLAYIPFGEWWFLRFVLPSWTALAVGTAALLLAAGAAAGRRGRVAAALAIGALGVFAVATALRLGVYPPGEGERRYATIAEVVARHTEADAVIITEHNSGPIGYYGGRVALRYDELDPAWLDRAVAWLEQQGRKPYVLVEEWELDAFRRRFAGQHAAREMSPVLAYRAHLIPARVYLFDPARTGGATLVVPPIRNPDRCAAPAR